MKWLLKIVLVFLFLFIGKIIFNITGSGIIYFAFLILSFLYLYPKTLNFIFNDIGFVLSRKEYLKLENEKRLEEIQRLKKEKNIKKHGTRCFNTTTDGERDLLRLLKEELSFDIYYIFSDLTLPNNLIGSSQIDHLVVSEYGIFVIENKDYSGWIFANRNNKNWTQIIYKSKKFFNNPINQNSGHIKTLIEVFNIKGLNKKIFFNTVSFSEKSEFKTERIDNVFTYKETVNFILGKKEKIISQSYLENILGKLFILCQTIDIQNEEHIINIEKYLEEKKEIAKK